MSLMKSILFFAVFSPAMCFAQQPQPGSESRNPPAQAAQPGAAAQPEPQHSPKTITDDDADSVSDSFPPLIDEKAAATLKRMSDYLAGLRSFRFEAEAEFDELGPDDQKIQLARRLDVSVERPNKIRFEMKGDAVQRVAWYDGRQVSILRADKRVCCQVSAPETIDATLAYMSDNYDLSTPCADFLYSDIATGLVMNVRTGRYLGVHQIGENRCHHLAFTQNALDWQIWIDDSDKPLPRKFVITYKTVDMAPQYAVRFTRWETDAKFPEKHFAFAFPPDMARVELLRVTAETPRNADQPPQAGRERSE